LDLKDVGFNPCFHGFSLMTNLAFNVAFRKLLVSTLVFMDLA